MQIPLCMHVEQTNFFFAFFPFLAASKDLCEDKKTKKTVVVMALRLKKAHKQLKEIKSKYVVLDIHFVFNSFLGQMAKKFKKKMQKEFFFTFRYSCDFSCI